MPAQRERRHVKALVDIEILDEDELLPEVAAALQRNRTALLGGTQEIHEEARREGEAGASDAG